MSQHELEQKINLAVFAAIASVIPWYFRIVKVMLFLVALVFAIVIVGLMLAGKVLLNAIRFVNIVQQAHAHKSAGAMI